MHDIISEVKTPKNTQNTCVSDCLEAATLSCLLKKKKTHKTRKTHAWHNI